MKNDPRKPTLIVLPLKLKIRLKTLAAKQQTTMSEIVEGLINDYLNKQRRAS